MAKKTTKVQHSQLYLTGNTTPLCLVGSSDWFAWLEAASTFRYHSDQRLTVVHGYSRPMRPISVRKEKRRHGFLWYAYLRSHGQLHKRYVGKTEALTVARLDEIAALLNQI